METETRNVYEQAENKSCMLLFVDEKEANYFE